MIICSCSFSIDLRLSLCFYSCYILISSPYCCTCFCFIILLLCFSISWIAYSVYLIACLYLYLITYTAVFIYCSTPDKLYLMLMICRSHMFSTSILLSFFRAYTELSLTFSSSTSAVIYSSFLAKY